VKYLLIISYRNKRRIYGDKIIPKTIIILIIIVYVCPLDNTIRLTPQAPACSLNQPCVYPYQLTISPSLHPLQHNVSQQCAHPMGRLLLLGAHLVDLGRHLAQELGGELGVGGLGLLQHLHLGQLGLLVLHHRQGHLQACSGGEKRVVCKGGG